MLHYLVLGEPLDCLSEWTWPYTSALRDCFIKPRGDYGVPYSHFEKLGHCANPGLKKRHQRAAKRKGSNKDDGAKMSAVSGVRDRNSVFVCNSIVQRLNIRTEQNIRVSLMYS